MLTIGPIVLPTPSLVQNEKGNPMSAESPDRIIRIKAVLDRTGLTRSTLYRKIQQGTFPKQVRIADRCAGWRESAVTEWLREPKFHSADG